MELKLSKPQVVSAGKADQSEAQKGDQIGDAISEYATWTLLGIAMERHQEGRLLEAKILYQTVLEREPDHDDAQNLLDLLMKQFDEAESNILAVSN
jgi:hypothetical protein